VNDYQQMQKLIEEFPNWSGDVSGIRRSKAVLRRLLGYAEKVFALSLRVIDPVSDRRPEPRIATVLVVKACFINILGGRCILVNPI